MKKDFTRGALIKLLNASSGRPNLRGVCLDGMILSGIDFRRAHLDFASFRGSDLSCAILDRCTMYRADFTGAKFIDASMKRVKAEDASFRDAVFSVGISSDSDTSLIGSSFAYSDLSNATLCCVNANRANFMMANLDGADIQWMGTNARTSFEGASMANAKCDGVRLFECTGKPRKYTMTPDQKKFMEASFVLVNASEDLESFYHEPAKLAKMLGNLQPALEVLKAIDKSMA